MKFLKLILLIPAFLVLFACAMVDSVGREPTSREESNVPRVYYAGVAGLKMFSQSRTSGSPIAELPLHTKVLRYKVERGFAYVKVPQTGRMGWVRNKDLIWRKRTSKQKSTRNASSPPQKMEVAPENTPGVDADPNPDPNPEIKRRDASMFDAF